MNVPVVSEQNCYSHSLPFPITASAVGYCASQTLTAAAFRSLAEAESKDGITKIFQVSPDKAESLCLLLESIRAGIGGDDVVLYCESPFLTAKLAIKWEVTA